MIESTLKLRTCSRFHELYRKPVLGGQEYE